MTSFRSHSHFMQHEKQQNYSHRSTFMTFSHPVPTTVTYTLHTFMYIMYVENKLHLISACAYTKHNYHRIKA